MSYSGWNATGSLLQGIGLVFAGVSAAVALCHTNELFNKVLQIQQLEIEIKQAVTELKDGVSALGDILKRLEAKRLAQTIPPNPTIDDLKNFMLSIPESATSGVYLKSELRPEAIKRLEQENTVQGHENVLEEYLQYKLP